MPRFKDQAICIRLIDWSETSQVVGLLTQNHGKLSAVAKGSKRTSPGAVARFGGGIELLTQGQAVGVIKAGAELANLTEWDLQAPYRHLRLNLQAQQLGLYAADLTGALLADHDPHPNTFAALSQLLGDLANPTTQGATLLTFQWRVLEDCGYKLELNRDIHSGQPLDNPQNTSNWTGLFDPKAGGITADLSSTKQGLGTPENNWRVRWTTVQALRCVAGGQTVIDQPSIERANRLLCVYTRSILDRQLPTMEYVLQRG